MYYPFLRLYSSATCNWLSASDVVRHVALISHFFISVCYDCLYQIPPLGQQWHRYFDVVIPLIGVRRNITRQFYQCISGWVSGSESVLVSGCAHVGVDDGKHESLQNFIFRAERRNWLTWSVQRRVLAWCRDGMTINDFQIAGIRHDVTVFNHLVSKVPYVKETELIRFKYSSWCSAVTYSINNLISA